MIDFSRMFDKENEKKDESLAPKQDEQQKIPLPEEKHNDEKSKKISQPLDFSSLLDKKSKEEETAKEESVAHDSSIDFSSLTKVPLQDTPAIAKNLPQQQEPKIPDTTPQDTVSKASPVVEKPPVSLDDIDHAIDLARKVFELETKLSDDEVGEIAHMIDNILHSIKTDRRQLYDYIFGSCLPEGINPYVLNLINVSILSLELGIALEYTHSELNILGYAAFLHNVGLKVYRDLINQPRRLSAQERQKIQKHPQAAPEALKDISHLLDKSVIEVVARQHERIGDSQFSRNLSHDKIAEYAQIIGLVDVYEALTHKRPYRDKTFKSIEAIKIILEDKRAFDQRLTKIFLELIGLYPIGTFVELNTKEVAQVIEQNHRMPSSPMVRVVYDQSGKKIDHGRDIDLSKDTKIFITENL